MPFNQHIPQYSSSAAHTQYYPLLQGLQCALGAVFRVTLLITALFRRLVGAWKQVYLARILDYS